MVTCFLLKALTRVLGTQTVQNSRDLRERDRVIQASNSIEAVSVQRVDLQKVGLQYLFHVISVKVKKDAI